MIAVLGVSEVVEEITKGVDLAVDVSHDIDRAIKQGLDEGGLRRYAVLTHVRDLSFVDRVWLVTLTWSDRATDPFQLAE
jgi:hypothetical protein